MNAILIFPTALAAELQQLRCEVESHRQTIEVDTAAFEQSRAVWIAHESDISWRLMAIRQRLAGLLA